MKKVIKLSETDLKNIIRVALKEAEHEHNRYMFFSNLEQMKRQAELLLDLNPDQIHSILENGHDWADDHAKAKFDVYPSAYANGYAVQVCKGTKPGLDGKKRCSGVYC